MIIDSFMFFNELDVLEIRLREFGAGVDRRVVIESSVTHQGQPKASCSRGHRERFAPWNDRMVGVIVEPQGQTPREREAAQRRAIRVGLEQAGVRRSDVVLLADADEIPAAGAVRRFAPAQGAAGFEQHTGTFPSPRWDLGISASFQAKCPRGGFCGESEE